MSEQENQTTAEPLEPGMMMVTSTHSAALNIGDDGRQVMAHRLIDGGYHLEWFRPDQDKPGNQVRTGLTLSKEALEATLNCIFAINNTVANEIDAAEAEAAAAVPQ